MYSLKFKWLYSFDTTAHIHACEIQIPVVTIKITVFIVHFVFLLVSMVQSSAAVTYTT